jgi:hypothetical protein
MEKLSNSKFSNFKSKDFIDLRNVIGGYCTSYKGCVDTAHTSGYRTLSDQYGREMGQVGIEDIDGTDCSRSTNDTLKAAYPGDSLNLPLNQCTTLIWKIN